MLCNLNYKSFGKTPSFDTHFAKEILAREKQRTFLSLIFIFLISWFFPLKLMSNLSIKKVDGTVTANC